MRGDTQFHTIAFEGPDAYARAGGIASRVRGLTQALADGGRETHLWFVGDPELPGHERRGSLRLHRWCQWISRYHPGGVYDGEEGKRLDLASSLPPYLMQEVLLPFLRDRGRRAVVLAEEWQTADAVLHLEWLLRVAGVRDRVTLLWNANNVFGFDRVPWPRLAQAATITTVSRYMRQKMWSLGVDPLVIPNGLPAETLVPSAPELVAEFRRRMENRLALAKVARWDPDKRWLLAVDTMADLKRRGWRPLLIARGGVEAHGAEVLTHAAAAGLGVAERGPRSPLDLLASLDGLEEADIVVLTQPLGPDACRLLYQAADAVLANSGHEPFGLVGLETMAAGGLACTGGTGEDYVMPGWNALVLQTVDPAEFFRVYHPLRIERAEERALRRHGRVTAMRYDWSRIIDQLLLPHLDGPAQNHQSHQRVPTRGRRDAGAARVSLRRLPTPFEVGVVSG